MFAYGEGGTSRTEEAALSSCEAEMYTRLQTAAAGRLWSPRMKAALNPASCAIQSNAPLPVHQQDVSCGARRKVVAALGVAGVILHPSHESAAVERDPKLHVRPLQVSLRQAGRQAGRAAWILW